MRFTLLSIAFARLETVWEHADQFPGMGPSHRFAREIKSRANFEKVRGKALKNLNGKGSTWAVAAGLAGATALGLGTASLYSNRNGPSQPQLLPNGQVVGEKQFAPPPLGHVQ